jgi:hypothetical protein
MPQRRKRGNRSSQDTPQGSVAQCGTSLASRANIANLPREEVHKALNEQSAQPSKKKPLWCHLHCALPHEKDLDPERCSSSAKTREPLGNRRVAGSSRCHTEDTSESPISPGLASQGSVDETALEILNIPTALFPQLEGCNHPIESIAAEQVLHI